MKNIVLFFILLFMFNVVSYSQIYEKEDSLICMNVFEYAQEKNLAEKPISEVIVEVGKFFLGYEYLFYALEHEGDEQLVINLKKLNCTTFMVQSLAFSRCIKLGKTTFNDFAAQLQKIRYRDGIIDKYPSRLHYTSDWIHNNEKKGTVVDITQKIGGEPLKFNLNFMSENPKYYSKLQEFPEYIDVMRGYEEAINERLYCYIPQDRIEEFEDSIQPGDLICLTTNVKGLDIGHVGIAVRGEDGRIHFMHAPQKGSLVQVSDLPLAEYTRAVKKHTGVIVLRAVEPELCEK